MVAVSGGLLALFTLYVKSLSGKPGTGALVA